MDTVDRKKRAWIMARVRSSGNRSTELRFVSLLRKHRLSGWRRHFPLMGRPDFVFPSRRVVVFVDGCFWHGHPKKCRLPATHRDYWRQKIARNVTRDRRVTRSLRQQGWKVIRVWEDSIHRPSVAARLRKALT